MRCWIGAGTIREPCKIKTPDAMYSHHKQINRVRASTHHSQASPGRRLLSTLTPFALRTKLGHVTVCDDIVLRADGKDRVREDRCDEGEYASCAHSVAPRLRACSLRTERLDIRRQRHARSLARRPLSLSWVMTCPRLQVMKRLAGFSFNSSRSRTVHIVLIGLGTASEVALRPIRRARAHTHRRTADVDAQITTSTTEQDHQSIKTEKHH